MKLYELSSSYRQLDAAHDEDMDDAEFIDLLAKVEGALKEKATNVAMVVLELDASADAIKQAEKRMETRRKAIERRASFMRTYLLQNMIAAGIHLVECPQFVMKVKDNPPSIVIDEGATIPAEYLRQPPPVPDKKALLDDIKQGVVIEGIRAERGQRLEIK